MATAYLTALSDAFQERYTPGVRDVSIENDPVFANMIDSSMRVAREPFSNDYKVYYQYTGALAGGIQFSTIPNNDMVLDGTDRANIIDNLPSFPGLRDSGMPSVGRYSIGLTSLRGNIFMPFAASMANELPASLNDMPALIMRKHIEYVGHLMACGWYADANGGLAQIAAQADLASVSRTGNTVTITAAAGSKLIQDGRIRRLKPGMYVDVYDSTYATKQNANGFCMVIGAINYQNNAAVLKLYFSNAADAQACDTKAEIENCWIVHRDGLASAATGKSRLPCGYQTFVISSGTLYGYFGDLDITTVPEMASVTASTVGDVSEYVLNQYLCLFNESVGGDIDSFFTSGGVIVNLLDLPTSNNWNSYERQGENLNLRMGWNSIDYTYDGRTYKIYQSPYITKGHLVGLKVRGGNLQRHYPPKVPGTGTKAGFDSAIQWVGNKFYGSIWMPTMDGNRVTEGSQAPYLFNLQTSAEDPRGILLTGCTEDSLGA